RVTSAGAPGARYSDDARPTAADLPYPGRTGAGSRPRRPEGWTERPLPVRLRQEVQAVPRGRGLTPDPPAPFPRLRGKGEFDPHKPLWRCSRQGATPRWSRGSRPHLATPLTRQGERAGDRGL